MNIQLLYELEPTVEELAKMKMSKSHEEKVTEISYSIGKLSGYLSNSHSTRRDLESCLKELVRIRRLSKGILSGRSTKKVRRKVSEVLGLVGYLESQVRHDLQRPRFIQRVRNLFGSVTASLVFLRAFFP